MTEITSPPADIPPEWRNILRRGERILWQGAPSTDVPYEKPTFLNTLFGLAAMIVIPIIIFRNLNENSQHPIFRWLLALIFMAAAGWQTFGRPSFASYKIRHSFYTLTNRRAFAGWLLWGHRRLDTYDITPRTKIELDSKFHGSVYFAEKTHHSKHSSRTEKIGFLNIREAQAVYELMLKIQKGDV